MKLQPVSKTRSQKISAKVIGGFSLLAVFFVANTAFAQQGDECLACHTGLPATEQNVISEETPSRTETPTTPANSPAPVDDECNYDNALLFDGWGWNAATRQSCPPIENPVTVLPSDSDCDFSRATEFDGWGWNPILRQSCPPEANVSNQPVIDGEPHADFTICSATYFDSDGDGFGWENEASCIITSESAPPPVITNRATGLQVDLKRAFWDGNTDIANKKIQCDLYRFDSYRGTYLQVRTYEYGDGPYNTTYPTHQFLHQSLPPARPFNGWIGEAASIDRFTGVFNDAAFEDTPYWTVDDGRYVGPTMLQAPYYETAFRSRGKKAVRIWLERDQTTALGLQYVGNKIKDDGYYECWDPAGSDLEPTGRPGGGTSSPVTKSDLVFSVAPNSNNQVPDTVVDLETGESVEMIKAYWDYNKDLAGTTVSCEMYFWEPDPYGGGLYINLAIPVEYRFPDHFSNSGSRLYYWQDEVGEISQNSVVVTDGVLAVPDTNSYEPATLFNSEYVSVQSGVVQFWTASEEFTSCNMNKPSGSAPVVADNNVCDYRNSALFNGWGWNPVTRQSCPPVPTIPATTPATTPADDCDYSNALLFDGWGWNPVTSQSCPPVGVPAEMPVAADDCDYRNALQNNGWGWNPVTSKSCPPK